MNNKTFAASNVCVAEKSNDLFLFVTMRLLSTRVNRNGDAVTAEFIDEIVSRQDTYGGLPVYVDIQRLLAGDLTGLGHMYNRVTGKFGTTQVGSLCNFQKAEDEYGISLLGEARFPKREAEVCQRIMELYANGALNFSFEIRYVPDAVVHEDGAQIIQANEQNMLTGLAIVSVPANKEAVALSLVAEEEQRPEETAMPAGQGGTDKVEPKKREPLQEEQTPVTPEPDVTEEETKEEENPPQKVETAEEPVVEIEVTQEEIEDAKLDAAHMEIEAEVAKLRAQIAAMEAEITALRAEHDELEAIRAARRAEELQRRRDAALAFAKSQGLNPDVADVSDAIAGVDYEKLAMLAMEKETQKCAAVTLASVTPELNTKSNRERLFEKDL